MKQFWSELGSKLGVGLCGAGLLLVFLGWNGAASVDRVESQFPYLISGGIAGLSLVLVGVSLIIVQNQRADRAELQKTLRELKAVLDGNDPMAVEYEPPAKRPTPQKYAAALQPGVEVVDDTVVETDGDDDDADGDDGPKRRPRRQLRADDA